MPIEIAKPSDIPVIELLLNRAYRGNESKQGWTSEADLIQGELRTDATTLLRLMNEPGAVFLKYTSDEGLLSGCVFLQKKKNKLYLGMLSVTPAIQAKGIGKQLMEAAEKYAIENNCQAIFMKVISLRHELIAWYERKGYCKTGEREPFPTDTRFGVPVQDLEFVIMEKTL